MRSVHASGNHAPYSRVAVPESQRLGPKALEKAWQEGQQRLQQEMSGEMHAKFTSNRLMPVTGLGEQSLSVIRDIQGADASDVVHDDISTAADADGMDWEDVPLPEQPQDDYNTFAYAARDLMDER